MSYQVIPVNDSRTMDDFIRLPFSIYKNDPHWVAPVTQEVRRTLNPSLNPYFKNADLKLFLCRKEKEPVSRVAVIINRNHFKKFGVKAAFFGFFESLEDTQAAHHLFSAAENYCIGQGAELLEGPFNPHHYSELGLQTSGHGTPPTFFQTYNPPYYQKFLEHSGFSVAERLHTRKNETIRDYLHNRYKNLKASRVNGDYRIRPFNMRDIPNELERIREVNNDAFSDNWHFLPLSLDEYTFSAKYLRLVTKPELIQIVEHKGKPVAVLHYVLDVNPALKKMKGRPGPLKYGRFLYEKKKIRKLVIFSVAVKKAYQRGRAFYLILNAACRIAKKYDSLETTWMSEKNIPAVQTAQLLGLKEDKYFFIYKKHFSTIKKGK
ncbi:MAG: hypothetical protein JXB26_16575 [Candidatus Aminicenantes bacterium]|nr:hypothetical protein [Candidatus Aminicenantes bacterium]